MEIVLCFGMCEGLVEIKQDYKYLKNLVPCVDNLWDVYRRSVLEENVLPMVRREIKKYQRGLHALICTCKNVYINGYPQIETNLCSIG